MVLSFVSSYCHYAIFAVGPLKNSLMVKFQSDYSVNGEGFGATYIWHRSGSITGIPLAGRPSIGSPFAGTCPTSCPNFCNEGYRKEVYCTSCECRSAQGQELYKCGSENPKKACSCGYAADIQGCPACICDNPLPVVSSPCMY